MAVWNIRAYVCNECPKQYCTAQGLKRHHFYSILARAVMAVVSAVESFTTSLKFWNTCQVVLVINISVVFSIWYLSDDLDLWQWQCSFCVCVDVSVAVSCWYCCHWHYCADGHALSKTGFNSYWHPCGSLVEAERVSGPNCYHVPVKLCLGRHDQALKQGSRRRCETLPVQWMSNRTIS